MGCFSGRLMPAASDQKLFCKLCSPFCCSFNEFVEEKVITPSYSSAILTPPDTDMFCISMGLPILDISNKWNHIICDFCVWLLLLVIKLSRFYHTVAWTSTSLLLLVNNNLWYEYSILCLYSHQLIGIWIVSTFWLLRIMSIWCSCKSFYIHVGVCMLSHFSPVWRLVTLWTVAH